MRWKVWWMVSLIGTSAGALSTTVLSDEPPAQPLAEMEIASRFEAAAAELFKTWLALRPVSLKALELGSPRSGPSFGFLRCEDIAPPKLASIDVRKTDSLLTPFVGELRVETREKCHDRQLRPKMGFLAYSQEHHDVLAPQCLGMEYDVCLKAGGKPAWREGSAYDRAMVFDHNGHLTLTYRWTKGSWEFEREEPAESRKVPGMKL